LIWIKSFGLFCSLALPFFLFSLFPFKKENLLFV
jgi:hypothetical protein